jgi:hypothetical protein
LASVIRIIKSGRIRWTGHVARMGEMRNAYRILVGKPEGKRPLGIPRRRWVDNINSSVVACVFDAAVTFLPSHCLATIGLFVLSRRVF